MSKYDFGDKIIEGSTMEWAYNKIEPNSKVLELGPAVGTLTKALQEKKQCLVDIIEYDLESGEKAQKYARKAIIGEQGDLNKETWFEILKKNEYDYIVILDVLEHLYDPEKIMKKLNQVLKLSGKIILSMPNIAHNSILINLLNNKFEYTEVGLLDNTHIKFFTYASLKKMLENSGYFIVSEEAQQLLVGENEVCARYQDVPNDVENYLRKRKYADVYQFLFVADKNKRKTEKILKRENLKYTKYRFEVFDNKNINCIFETYLLPENMEIIIPIMDEMDEIRIDPLESNCVLRDMVIFGIGEELTEEINLSLTNGYKISENQMVFLDNDPQIIIKFEKNKYKQILFKAKVELFNSDAIALFKQNIIEKNLKYKFEVFNFKSSECIYEAHMFSEKIKVKIPIDKEIEEVRIDPIESNCVLRDMMIFGIGEELTEEINISSTNGYKISGNQMVFFDNDPQIIVKVQKNKYKEVLFSAEIVVYKNESIKIIKELIKK